MMWFGPWNSGRVWKIEDDYFLFDRRSRGTDWDDLANSLQRSVASVKKRYYMIKKRKEYKAFKKVQKAYDELNMARSANG